MFVALLLAVSFTTFASTQALQRAHDLAGDFDWDTVGATPPAAARDTAFIYAKFAIAGVAFAIVSEDVWMCSSLVPSETAVETSPMLILNTGGVAIDLGAIVVDEDIYDGVAPSPNEWVFDEGGSWAVDPAVPDHYILGLVIGDNVTASMATTDFGDDDILDSDDEDPLGAPTMYATGSYMEPAVGAYPHAGALSLNLWAGPNDGDLVYNEAADEDVVSLWFRVLMSAAGAGDTGKHAAQVKLAAQISAD